MMLSHDKAFYVVPTSSFGKVMSYKSWHTNFKEVSPRRACIWGGHSEAQMTSSARRLWETRWSNSTLFHSKWLQGRWRHSDFLHYELMESTLPPAIWLICSKSSPERSQTFQRCTGNLCPGVYILIFCFLKLMNLSICSLLMSDLVKTIHSFL